MNVQGLGIPKNQYQMQKEGQKAKQTAPSDGKPKADTYSISPEAKAKMEEVAKQDQKVGKNPEPKKHPQSSGLIAGYPDYQLRLDNDPVTMPSYPDEEATRPTPEQSQGNNIIYLDPKEIQRMLASDPLPTMPLLGTEEQHGDATTFPSLAEEENFPVAKTAEELESEGKENLKNTMAELYSSGNAPMMMAFLDYNGEDYMKEALGDDLFSKYFAELTGTENTADKIREILNGTAQNNTLLESLFPSK
ncbi:MAG: hypothetical protein R3Y63_14225 [Eubacteriales bacterium]